MGKYDINATFNEVYAVTITELCNELLDEAEQTSNGEKLNFDLVRSKFSNSYGNGIIQKLQGIGFDVWGIAGVDKREKYDAIKVLKLFYYVEKDTLYQRKRSNITTVLANPSLDNLEGYKRPLNKIYEAVYSQIADAAHYEGKLRAIDRAWRELIADFSEFMYSPDFLSNYDRILVALRQIDAQLATLDTFKNVPPSECNDGIMRTLLLFLIRYGVSSENASFAAKQNEAFCLTTPDDSTLSRGYFLNKTLLENVRIITWEQIDAIVEELKNLPHDMYLMYIMIYALGAVTEKDFVSSKNKAYRIDAFRYVRKIATWLQSRYDGIDFQQGVPPYVLAGITQSIYYASKNHETYTMSSYGNYRNRTLMAAIKDDGTTDTAAMLDWENRIANRILALLGKPEIAEYHRNIQQTLIAMENMVFAQNSFAEIQRLHEVLYAKAKGICGSSMEDKAEWL